MTDALKPTCQCLFQQDSLEGAALQDAVYGLYPEGDCELEKLTKHSVGPVQSGEILTRLIIHPIHIDEDTGKILPMAFHDACTLDMSVFRESHATDAEIQLSIGEIKSYGLLKAQERIVSAISQAKAVDIRNLIFDSDGARMCFVYDTACEQKPSHASIFTAKRTRSAGTASATRRNQREVRKKLFEIFNEAVLEPEKYRKIQYGGTLR